MSDLSIDVDIDQLMSELHQLAAISDCVEPPPTVTRVVFTQTDLKAREYLMSLYQAAGLRVHVDAIGNTYARWVGSDADAAAVGTGSHTDAIPIRECTTEPSACWVDWKRSEAYSELASNRNDH